MGYTSATPPKQYVQTVLYYYFPKSYIPTEGYNFATHSHTWLGSAKKKRFVQQNLGPGQTSGSVRTY